jgi:hypothetical protein
LYSSAFALDSGKEVIALAGSELHRVDTVSGAVRRIRIGDQQTRPIVNWSMVSHHAGGLLIAGGALTGDEVIVSHRTVEGDEIARVTTPGKHPALLAYIGHQLVAVLHTSSAPGGRLQVTIMGAQPLKVLRTFDLPSTWDVVNDVRMLAGEEAGTVWIAMTDRIDAPKSAYLLILFDDHGKELRAWRHPDPSYTTVARLLVSAGKLYFALSGHSFEDPHSPHWRAQLNAYALTFLRGE